MPFQEDKRMVEYYEGFLMAVDSLKRTGTSIDLYVYDCGKDVSTLNSILAKNEMKSMNVIFGPMHQQQIKPLSTFAKKNDIRLVIPFSSKGEEVFNNPAIYQIKYTNTLPANFRMQTSFSLSQPAQTKKRLSL